MNVLLSTYKSTSFDGISVPASTISVSNFNKICNDYYLTNHKEDLDLINEELGRILRERFVNKYPKLLKHLKSLAD